MIQCMHALIVLSQLLADILMIQAHIVIQQQLHVIETVLNCLDFGIATCFLI